jgi:hypothetical protein
MNGILEVDDVCGNTHVYRDQSLEEAFGRVGPKCPVKWNGEAGQFLQLHTGRLVFFPDRLRLMNTQQGEKP